MNTAFHIGTGDLSAYAFACGYIQQRNGWQLFKDGCWHVRLDSENWFTYGTLTEARKAFRSMSKKSNICAWCDKANLATERSFNGKDICNDCEDIALGVDANN